MPVLKLTGGNDTIKKLNLVKVERHPHRSSASGEPDPLSSCAFSL